MEWRNKLVWKETAKNNRKNLMNKMTPQSAQTDVCKLYSTVAISAHQVSGYVVLQAKNPNFF